MLLIGIVVSCENIGKIRITIVIVFIRKTKTNIV